MKKILAASFLFVFFLGVFVFWFAIFVPLNSRSVAPVAFVVQKGDGSSVIAKNLRQEGFIRSAFLFRVLLVVSGLSHTLKAGAYELSPSMSAAQIAKKLANGDVIKEFVTIPDGWTLEDIAHVFEQEKFFPAQDFLAAAQGMEGYLFPDTYQVSRTQTPKDVVGQMLQNFDRHFTNDMRQEALRQKKTISQIVSMASILEKEVQTPEDKKIVAGILWKRMQNGIPLQVDAAPQTYNTRGLPQNPISNPGTDSILAALHPTPSPYWYYLSTKTGKTIFSKTLDQHNAAKAQYLR